MSLFKKWQNQVQVLVEAKEAKNLKSAPSCLLVIAQDLKELQSLAKDRLYDWQFKNLKDSDKNYNFFQSETYQVATFVMNNKQTTKTYSGFEENLRVSVRNQVGLLSGKCERVEVLLGDKLKDADQVISGIVEAVTLGSYSYKNTEKSRINLYMDKKYMPLAKKAWHKADAMNFSRFLVDAPPNELHPQAYVSLVKELIKNKKSFKMEVKSKDLEKEGYGLIHAVGKGGSSAPAIVKVSYSSQKTKSKKIAFVGKGITFDTGGLDLKPAQYMRFMKKDMGGSAAVAGLLYYHLQVSPKNSVDYYLAIAENSVNSNSFRPGDVYTAGNGLSVEIHNTDAEGRLALADALSWLGKDKNQPHLIIDVATLTGAIKAGLGAYVGGLFSNDENLAQEIFQASERSGDALWPMPMPHWSEDDLKKSQVADLVNACDGYGGAITAAQFLKQFLPKKTKWAHLDVYGWVDAQRGPLKQKGGSGQGVLALLDFLENY